MKGFTLIELLAVFGILAVLTVVSIASFSSYNTNQVIESSASDVSSPLYTARSKAIDRVKPTECLTQTLTGYQVSLTIPPSQYQLNAICESDTYLIEQRTLPEDVTFSEGSSTNILFNAMSGSIDSPAMITISGDNKHELITVDTIGSISRSTVSVPPTPLVTSTPKTSVTPTPQRTQNITVTPTPTATQNTCSKNYSCMFFLGCFRTVTGTGQYCSSTCDNAC